MEQDKLLLMQLSTVSHDWGLLCRTTLRHAACRLPHLQVSGAGEQGVKAGGTGLRRRRAYNIAQPCQLVLADQARQATRIVLRLNQEARCVRVMALCSSMQ